MRTIYRLLFLLCTVGLAVACRDENELAGGGRVKEGIPTQVELRYDVRHNKVISRIAQDPEYEYRVENLYVYVFDGNGDVQFQHFFTEGNGLIVDNGTNATSGSVDFQTTSVNGATIVGIANLTNEGTATAYDVTKDELDNIATLGELKKLVMPMHDQSVSRGALFMMTGYAKDKQGNTSIDIPASEAGATQLDCTLELDRTDAKVEFNVTCQVPSGKNWKNMSFVPGTYQILEVPQQSLLLPAGDGETPGDADGDGCQYFNTVSRPFETFTKDDGSNTTGGGFVFYMPENRKAPKKEIEATGSEGYALRDESNSKSVDGDETGKPGQIYENTDFMYADDHATYAILTGTLSYIDDLDMPVNASVRFIIHLGYASGDPNDYDTDRNTHYQYAVTVQGVDDIIVEVTDGEERRPGYEGDVVYSSSKIFELDSHYDRALLEIRKDQITDQMAWAVKTPFSSGIHTVGLTKDDIPDNLLDYRWIKFAINRDYGFGEGRYVKYPGDQNYDDPLVEGDGLPSPSYNGTIRGLGNYPNARLLDIDQLIRRLKEEKANPNSTIFEEDGHVCITAFIDEYLYFNDPLTGAPGEDNRSRWKESVDKEDRQLHIIAAGSQYSPDGNSSVVNSLYTFKQRSIQTVFNVDKEDLTTAWGTESIMELEEANRRLLPLSGQASTYSGQTSTSNGRANTLRWMNDLNWTEVLNTSEHYGLNEGYESAAYACLLRNRDLNGDNKIDAREVRWYLAAIDQLTELFIGENALDVESRLYPDQRPGGNSVYWHYTSSSLVKKGEPWVLWAEEGASRGSYIQSSANTFNGPRYAYRCLRNLGLNIDNPDEEPAKLVQYENTGNNRWVIDMTNMNEKARRTNRETSPLPAHHERSLNNMPYAKFELLWDAYPTPTYNRWNRTWNTESWSYFQTINRCPTGYRIPNHREFLIMTSGLPDEAWHGRYTSNSQSIDPNYTCQSSFSMKNTHPYDNQREGFWWSKEGKTFYLQNSRSADVGYIRCIRDVRE